MSQKHQQIVLPMLASEMQKTVTVVNNPFVATVIIKLELLEVNDTPAPCNIFSHKHPG